jgi:hypothetical protein
MNRKLIAIPAIALTAGISLAACGTSHTAAPKPAVTVTQTATPSAPPSSAPASAPPAPAAAAAAAVAPGDAASTLVSDGYTLVLTESPATISATFGAAGPYVTSAAGGTSGDGTTIEVVVYVDASEIDTLGGPAAATTALGTDLPGATVTTTPAGASDVLRFTGPASAFPAS